MGNWPGQFRTPHALAFDTKGRLFVADRCNNRIQIFNQDGKLLDTYLQFSRVSRLFITTDDTLYAIDSESKSKTRPGWKTGIRIENAAEDRATAYIPPHPSQTRWFEGVAGEGVAVDADGNVYAAEGPGSRKVVKGGITKYMPKPRR